jgi:hypothetical protein
MFALAKPGVKGRDQDGPPLALLLPNRLPDGDHLRHNRAANRLRKLWKDTVAIATPRGSGSLAV